MAAQAIFQGFQAFSSFSINRSRKKKEKRRARSALTVQLTAQSAEIRAEIDEVKRRTAAEAQLRAGVKSQLSRAKNQRPGLADIVGPRTTAERDGNGFSFAPIAVLIVVGIGAFFLLR